MTRLACAIYTRKSSDEGLDQAFNSLDAQREAGEAYVKSQASEGWRPVPTRYDDGGFSGGSMERPALQRLLADVEAGLVDVVVVYKIDRLTRSLADFARIVERFDARGVSFVSVTQAFNTTSSMGRLTLNVLLSFAQFEREVTGERIRDKIAASKARGMWMGGVLPLGYDLPAPGTRTLQVNEAEAATVGMIFTRYLALGSVHRLAAELAEAGIRSKQRVTTSGGTMDGTPFSRGALFHLLRNALYVGKIAHKGVLHDGAHEAIVDAGLFEQVQQLLDRNGRRRSRDATAKVAGAMLTGRILDAAGAPMSPAFSYGRGGRVYRYYVSAPLQKGRRHKGDEVLRRIAAPALEHLVRATCERLGLATDQLACVQLRKGGIELVLPGACRRATAEHLVAGEHLDQGPSPATCALFMPVALPLRGGRRAVAAGQPQAGSPDPVLIAALRKAHAMVSRDAGGLPTVRTAPVSPYDRRLLRLAFLAPAIQRDILAGRQPAHINLEFLMKREIPLAWSEQRERFYRR